MLLPSQRVRSSGVSNTEHSLLGMPGLAPPASLSVHALFHTHDLHFWSASVTLCCLQTLSHQFANSLPETVSNITCSHPGQCCPQMGIFFRYGKYETEKIISLSPKTGVRTCLRHLGERLEVTEREPACSEEQLEWKSDGLLTRHTQAVRRK